MGMGAVCVCVSVFVALTCFADPLQVSVELSLNLLLSPQLEELAPVLHSLSLFGKFTADTFVVFFFAISICSFVIKRTQKISSCKNAYYGILLKKEEDLTLRVHPAPG